MKALPIIASVAAAFLITGCAVKGPTDESTLADVRIENPRYMAAVNPPRGEETVVCSFNIKFLGFYSDKRSGELAELMQPCDIVAIQELVSAPFDMPHLLSDSGNPLSGDAEAKQFFDAMTALGFQYHLSEEDTGPNRNHVNNTESEWFVAFYKDDRVELWPEYTKFIDSPLTGNRNFARVPYAFGFKAKNTNGETQNDFVLISCHLIPDASGETTYDDRQRELSAIKKWIIRQKSRGDERDYIVLGDMNVQNRRELRSFLRVPPRDATLWSLNWRGAGTNLRKRKPYEQVLFNPRLTSEMSGQMEIIDITRVWDVDEFESNMQFAQYYSDHMPVVFRVKVHTDDD